MKIEYYIPTDNISKVIEYEEESKEEIENLINRPVPENFKTGELIVMNRNYVIFTRKEAFNTKDYTKISL